MNKLIFITVIFLVCCKSQSTLYCIDDGYCKKSYELSKDGKFEYEYSDPTAEAKCRGDYIVNKDTLIFEYHEMPEDSGYSRLGSKRAIFKLVKLSGDSLIFKSFENDRYYQPYGRANSRDD